MTGCYHRFLDVLRNLSFSEACGEVAGNVFVFFCTGPVRGVVAGVAGVLATDLVRFGCGEVAVAVPLDVLPFLLLDYRRLV